jgi:hypothetical protein
LSTGFGVLLLLLRLSRSKQNVAAVVGQRP